MPAPAPFSNPNAQSLSYPALYLYPLNDSFIPKHIALSHGQHVKIGRQTNAKTAPGERNGYFDSKVLSRQHAEVWEENGKIFIKDVKSSNGTFINGERLSSEAVESEPYELKSDDIVEFGIDIVGEDNKTIIHHKVAARVVCVFSEQDAQVAARAEQHQHQQQQFQQAAASSLMGQPGPSAINGAPSGFNFNGAQQRRPPLSQPSLGSMSGGMRPPGKSGLTFDVILSRLQGELQKSRETGAELNTLTGAMNEIHDTLSGGLPANLPPYPSVLPPVRPPQEPAPPPPPATSPPEQPPAPPPVASNAIITELQAQLRETQSSLASQLEKIRALESVLAEQEAMKHEVKTLREMMETRRREMEDDEVDHQEEDEEDDARSIHTIVPHELERVEEEDEDQLVEDRHFGDVDSSYRQNGDGTTDEQREAQAEAHAREEMERQSDLERPRTPEPIRMGLRDSDSYELQDHSGLLAAPRRASPTSPLTQVSAAPNTTEEIHDQIAQLTAQVSAVMQLTSTLEAQHTAAQSTIQSLETKVEALEAMLKTTQQARAEIEAVPPPPVSSSAPEPTEDAPSEHDSLTDRIAEWMKSVEGKWNTVQEEWNQERERLNKAREEWEVKVKQVDSGLERISSIAAESLNHNSLNQLNNLGYQPVGNGDVVKHNGLVTPPSPRSQSSDSGRYRRRRRRSTGASRGRSRSQSRSRSHSREPHADGEPEPLEASVSGDSKTVSANVVLETVRGHARALATPEPSVYKASSPSSDVAEVDLGSDQEQAKAAPTIRLMELNTINIQTAVGVLLLSVAAAAVIWKVKPE